MRSPQMPRKRLLDLLQRGAIKRLTHSPSARSMMPHRHTSWGATLEDDIGPIKEADETWRADPADWSWSDEGNSYRCDEIIGAILNDESRTFEKRAEEIFQGIVDGLKKFDISGQFKGKLSRDQMLLVLWINDPSERNAKSVMRWVGQINPEPVSQWFMEVYSYRG